MLWGVHSTLITFLNINLREIPRGLQSLGGGVLAASSFVLVSPHTVGGPYLWVPHVAHVGSSASEQLLLVQPC